MPDEKITLVRVTQTAMGCPTQWDAWDAAENYYYMRYRNGCGDVRQYKSENWVEAAWLPEDQIDKSQPGWGIRANVEFIRYVASFRHGDEYDGFISLEEFAEHAGLVLAENLAETSFGQMLADKMILEGIVGPEMLERKTGDEDEQ